MNIQIKKMKYKNLYKIVVLAMGLLGFNLYAQPIIIEGVVPNDSIKQEILTKLHATYGEKNVVDRIQIRPVTVPESWLTTVNNVINDDLKKVKQGKLIIKGADIQLHGKVLNPNEIKIMTKKIEGLIPENYHLNAQLTASQAEQQIIDAVLNNRIIEFESGSAVLAASGTQILNEMVIALNKVGGKKVRIIGHTDSSGDAHKNLVLSQQRATAVKNYLISKGIAAESLSGEGLGSTQPIADNMTVEGRKKNRRIEFEVL